MWRSAFWEQLAQDIRYGLRAMSANKLFTLMAVLSLALGIGANTAIYSFMDAILIRALPISHPEQLVVLNWRAKSWPEVAHSQHGDGYQDADGSSVSGTFPYPAGEILRDNNVLSTLFFFAGAGRLNLVVNNQAQLGGGEYVSGNFFTGLQTPPATGRLISPDDDRLGAPAVAVISYRVWQNRFGSSPNAIGQTMLINSIPFTVVGVTAPEFYGVNPRGTPDVYLPLHAFAFLDPRAQSGDWFHERNNFWVEMMGRLKPGVTLTQAQSTLAGIFGRFVASTATTPKERSNLPWLWLEEGGSGIDSLRRQYSKPLYVLMTMVGLILAIACANIANLLLSRATARRREMAVRLSLGAGRLRVIRQLLTESVLLSLLSGLAGLIVAEFGIRFLTWLLANGAENFTLRAQIDFRILLFTIAVSLATGLLFGLAPAIQSTRLDITPALKESRASVTRTRGHRFGLGQILIAAQIAISLLLVISAGLFVRTLANLRSVSLGFNKDNLLLFHLDAKQAGYDDPAAKHFYQSIRGRIASLSGVTSATVTDIPLVSDYSSSSSMDIPGIPKVNGRSPSANLMTVGASYFQTMQIPILAGRAIEDRDEQSPQCVAVVNEEFATKFFAGRSAIGQHVSLHDGKTPIDIEIVGIARNSLYSSLKRAIPAVLYFSWTQAPPQWRSHGIGFEVRTTSDPLLLANTVRQIVGDADPKIPVAEISTQSRRIDATIAPERTFADLCTCFGILALLIACVGLYGSMAYNVSRRTSEIGIRVALGAQRRRVIWMVLREVLILSAAGLAMGTAAAWQSSHLVASFLFGMKPNDPVVFAGAIAILAAAALIAGYAPAWRASRIDPMKALRHE